MQTGIPYQDVAMSLNTQNKKQLYKPNSYRLAEQTVRRCCKKLMANG